MLCPSAQGDEEKMPWLIGKGMIAKLVDKRCDESCGGAKRGNASETAECSYTDAYHRALADSLKKYFLK